MANNTRQKIKNKLDSTENDIIRAMTNLDLVMNMYDTGDIQPEIVKESIRNCMLLSQNSDMPPAMEIYRALLRTDDIPYLGRYDEYLFYIMSFYLSLESILDGLRQYKIWEAQIR